MIMEGKQVIGLTARAGSGKTTLARWLSEWFDRVKHVSLADPLKAYVKLMESYGGKSPERRLRLVQTGDRLLESFGGSLFVDALMSKLLLDEVYADYDTYVIDDVRTANEVQRLHQWSLRLGFRLRIFVLSVSEEELKRRLGDDYVPPDFPKETIHEAVRAAHELQVYAGTIFAPVMELSHQDLCTILQRNS